MNRADTPIVETLRKVEDEVGSLSLNNSEGWKKAAARLAALIDGIPSSHKDVCGLIAHCVRGLETLADRRVDDVLSLVNILCSALSAAAERLNGDSGAERAVAEAEEELNSFIGEGAGIFDSNSNEKAAAGICEGQCGKDEISMSVDLDDLALQLMQLEPEDGQQVARFRNSLRALIADSNDPEAARTLLSPLVAKLDDIIEHRCLDPHVALQQVGMIIEDAMKMAGQNDKTGVPGLIGKEEKSLSEEAMTSESPPEVGAEEQSNYMPDNGDPDILAEFVTESMELIADAEEALLELENNPDDADSVATVFRAFHTIKGTSAFLGVTIVSELAHCAESLLSRVRDDEIRYGGVYAELSLNSVDMLKDIIRDINHELGGNPLLKPEGYDSLINLLQNPDLDTGSENNESEEENAVLQNVTPRMGDILVAQGVDREKIEEVIKRASGNPLGLELLKEDAVSVKDVAKALRAQKRMKGGGKIVESSVRVQTDRLDRLIDMVGEMVIAHSMIAQDEAIIRNREQSLQKKIAHTSKIVRELQDLSMSMRMVPLKPTFQKMARIVRDLASKSGKNITFETNGEDTEIDRNMVDLINDPLMHMIRNAADHGIESSEERTKQGKPPQGTVSLSAYHSAGNVVVEIRDDGRGLDRETIVEGAREKGLISEDTSLSERDVWNLIFEPGFSTAQAVSDVSGRGVGLDVVKRNIESLRGKIELQSGLGVGTVFKVRVPLTLAIIDGMVILVGEERYILPTISIVRTLQLRQKDVSTIFNKGEMLSVEGRLIPLFRLTDLFHVRNAQQEVTQELVVVVEDNGEYAGLVADELLGQQQIVIKTLGETMRDVPGISGGAIMGDGRVGLILDVGGLVKMANSGRADDYAQAV